MTKITMKNDHTYFPLVRLDIGDWFKFNINDKSCYIVISKKNDNVEVFGFEQNTTDRLNIELHQYTYIYKLDAEIILDHAK